MGRYASRGWALVVALAAAMVFPLLSRAAPTMRAPTVVPRGQPRARQLAPAVQACLQLTREHLTAAATRNLSRHERGELQGVVSLLKGGKQDAAIAQWKTLIGRVATHPSSAGVDINAMIQLVLRSSYLEQTESLRYYAEKVSYFNEAKARLRRVLSAVRGKKAPVTGEELAVARPRMRTRWHGGPIAPPLTGVRVRLADEAARQSYLQRAEQQLRSIGDDAQLANVDLQNMLQKQQHTVQMLSKISKAMHDTAMATIRKIGG